MKMLKTNQIVIAISVVSLLIVPATNVYSQTGKFRVAIVPIMEEDANVQVSRIIDTTVDTMALTLRLLGRYEVSESRVGVPDRAAYLSRMDIGSVDRVLFVAVDREGGRSTVQAAVVNPLDGSVEIEGQETIDSLLFLFDAVDKLTSQLLGTLSGQRIAFGGISVQLGGWDISNVAAIELNGIPFAVDGYSTITNSRPQAADYRLMLDGVPVGEGLRADRLLVGRHQLHVERVGDQTEVFRTPIQVEEAVTTNVDFSPFLIDRTDAVALAGTVERANRARESYLSDRSDAAFREWKNAVDEIVPVVDRVATALPGDVLWTSAVTVERAWVTVAEVDQTLHRFWREPSTRWFSPISTAVGELRSVQDRIRSDGKGPESVVAATERAVDSVRRQAESVERSVLQAMSLAAVASFQDEEWFGVSNRYADIADQSAQRIAPDPEWLRVDRETIDQAFAQYSANATGRRGIYRMLSWGGATTFLAGAGAFGYGYLQELDAIDFYAKYVDSDVPEDIEQYRRDAEQSAANATWYQSGGVAAVGLGLGSFVTGVILQRRNQRKPEKALETRLEALFGGRAQLLEELDGRDPEQWPIPDFDQTAEIGAGR